jgi:processive 1,2-diacylglycerol beta-glucosyltransferase
MTTHAPKRILFLAVSLGSGHLRATEAVVEALHTLEPSCQTEVLDIKQLVSPLFRLIQFHGYEFLIERAPWIWRFLYGNSIFAGRKFAAPRILLERGNPLLVERIRQFAPEAIVSTQINCHELAYLLSQRGSTKTRLISVITDYDVHPIWSKTPADLLVVAHHELFERLLDLGVDRARVQASGIPIASSFRIPRDRQSVITRFGLRPEVATLLVMGGSVGFGELDEVVANLIYSGQQFQILAVAGHNEEVRHRLEQLKEKLDAHRGENREGTRSSLQVFGFVEFIPELMTVADCFISKPGGLATTEALATGLPMVFVNPIPGHEEKNAEFLVRHGAALAVQSICELRSALNSLFENSRAKLHEMQIAARSLANPDAAMRLAEEILKRDPSTPVTAPSSDSTEKAVFPC